MPISIMIAILTDITLQPWPVSSRVHSARIISGQASINSIPTSWMNSLLVLQTRVGMISTDMLRKLQEEVGSVVLDMTGRANILSRQSSDSMVPRTSQKTIVGVHSLAYQSAGVLQRSLSSRKCSLISPISNYVLLMESKAMIR